MDALIMHWWVWTWLVGQWHWARLLAAVAVLAVVAVVIGVAEHRRGPRTF
ncbi:hypothetical protein [Mycolicibacterium sphagni]|nr:hypothetical protein [Mycolicibacterium sphagni]MCV7174865.1 hypothetical protein [Mycolicibacterium sphagni]